MATACPSATLFSFFNGQRPQGSEGVNLCPADDEGEGLEPELPGETGTVTRRRAHFQGREQEKPGHGAHEGL